MPNEPALNESLWAVTATPAPASVPLTHAASADVAVVGAGYTGCSAALHLAQAGANVIVVEAGEIGAGASGRNTGFVNPGLFASPSAVIAALGPDTGERLIEGLGGATAFIRDLIHRHRIVCDADYRPIVRAAHSDVALRGLVAFSREWMQRGAPIEILSPAEVEAMTGITGTAGGVVDHRSFVIQPLSFARGLASAAVTAGASIHTGSPVRAVVRAGDRWRIQTPRGSITADRVIVATGAYAGDLLPTVRDGFVPVGAHLYATTPLPERARAQVLPKASAFYDTRKGMISLRSDRDGRFLIATLGYLPCPRKLGEVWLRTVLRRFFPSVGQQTIAYRWAGSIDLTPDRLPRLAAPMPGVLAAFGYCGRGIAAGTLWGKVLAQMVRGPTDVPPIIPFWKERPIGFRNLRARALQAAFEGLLLLSLSGR